MNHWKRRLLIVTLMINLIFVFSGCNLLEENKGYPAQPTEELHGGVGWAGIEGDSFNIEKWSRWTAEV